MTNENLTANGYLNKLHYARRGFFTTNDVYYSLWVIDEDEIEHCLMLTIRELDKAMAYFFTNCDKAVERKTNKSITEAKEFVDIGKLFYADDTRQKGVQKKYHLAVNVIDSEDDEHHCLLFTQKEFKDYVDRARKNIDYIPKKTYKGSF